MFIATRCTVYCHACATVSSLTSCDLLYHILAIGLLADLFPLWRGIPMSERCFAKQSNERQCINIHNPMYGSSRCVDCWWDRGCVLPKLLIQSNCKTTNALFARFRNTNTVQKRIPWPLCLVYSRHYCFSGICSPPHLYVQARRFLLYDLDFGFSMTMESRSILSLFSASISLMMGERYG